MPRIHQGTQKRYGTAGKRGLRPQESKWAAYDAGLTTEVPIATCIADDVPKRPRSLSSRRGTKRKAISLNDEEFILSTVEPKPKSTLKPSPRKASPVAAAPSPTTLPVPTTKSATAAAATNASPEEMISPRSARPAAVSISLSQIEPIELSEGTISHDLLQRVRAQHAMATAKIVAVAAATNHDAPAENRMATNNKQPPITLEGSTGSIGSGPTNEADDAPRDADTKPIAANDPLSPSPTPGDKVFDITDVLDSQTTLDDWEQQARMIMSFSPGPKSVPHRREERLFRSPVLELTFDVGEDDACVEKHLYFFDETKIAPVPILVNPISLAAPEPNQRHGVLVGKVSRWKQVSSTVVCIERDLEAAADIIDATFSETNAGRDLHWEAYLLQRILRAGPKQGIPKPLHLCVSATDKTLCLRMELDGESNTFGSTIFGSLEELLQAQVQYNQGGIPETVTAWLVVEMMSLLNCVHHAGVVHNNLCMESFLLVRGRDGETWSLVLNGFGAKGSTIDELKQNECCFFRDLRGVASLMWTLLVGGLPFSCTKKENKVELDNKSCITSNRFLRGNLGWEDLFQTLLNPPLASHGFHSMSDWSDLSHSLDLIKMMVPSSNGQTPAAVASFLDSLWSHCEGDTVRLTRAVSASTGDIEIARLRQLLAELEEKRKKVEQEKIALVASIELERTEALQLLERNRKQEMEHACTIAKARSEFEVQNKCIEQHRTNLVCIEEKIEIAAGKLRESNADKERLNSQLQQSRQEHSQALKLLEENGKKATEQVFTATKAQCELELQAKEIDQYRNTIKCLEEKLEIASGKLQESNTDKVRLNSQLQKLTEELQQSKMLAPSLILEGQVEILKQKLIESGDLHKQLKAQAVNLNHELQRWRGKANTIRCKAVELQQKELQLNRVQSVLGQALPNFQKSPRRMKRSIDSTSLNNKSTCTEKSPRTRTSPNGVVKRKSSPVEPGKSLLGLGSGEKSTKPDRLSGACQTIVAGDPYSMNSDSD